MMRKWWGSEMFSGSHFKAYYSFYVYLFVLLVYSIFDRNNAWGGGLGFDGVTYYKYSTCLPDCLFEIDSYHVNRLLLPSVARLVFYVLGISLTAHNFVIFSSVLNCVALLATFILCLKMLQASRNQDMQGLLLVCFIAYPLLKGPVFYPTLGDYASCFLFSALFFLLQNNKKWAYFVLSAVSFFCHALVLPVSAVLFCVDERRRWFMPRGVFVVLKHVFLGAIIFAAVSFVVNNIFSAPPTNNFITDLRVVTLALPVTVFMLLFISSRMLSSFDYDANNSRYVFPAIDVKVVSMFLALYLVLGHVKSYFQSSFISGSTLSWFVTHLLYNGSERPLASMSSNFLYFGPMYIFSLTCYLFYAERKSLSVRHSVALFLFFILSMRPESRTVMFFWPVIAVITLQNFGPLLVSSSRLLWVVVVVGVVTSQILVPTILLEQIDRQWISFIYFNYQGGYESVLTWIISLVCALALGGGIVFALRRHFDFSCVPRWIISPILCYVSGIVLIIYLLSFSSVSGLARDVLCITSRDLLSSGDTPLVYSRNMGDLEMDAEKRWKWGFGPSSDIYFFSLSKESLTLQLEFYAPVPSQSMWTVINGGTPLESNLNSLPQSGGFADGRRVLSIPFIPRFGINTISFSYSTWHGNGLETHPGDDRKFAVQFLKIILRGPAPSASLNVFPYHLFLYGNPMMPFEFQRPKYPDVQ